MAEHYDIAYEVVIVKSSEKEYDVWLAAEGESDDLGASNLSFCAGSFPNFDKAAGAALRAFPGRPIICKL